MLQGLHFPSNLATDHLNLLHTTVSYKDSTIQSNKQYTLFQLIVKYTLCISYKQLPSVVVRVSLVSDLSCLADFLLFVFGHTVGCLNVSVSASVTYQNTSAQHGFSIGSQLFRQGHLHGEQQQQIYCYPVLLVPAAMEANIFPKLYFANDLVLISEQEKRKMAISTTSDHFEYCVMLHIISVLIKTMWKPIINKIT